MVENRNMTFPSTYELVGLATYLGICEEKELLVRLLQAGEGALRALGGDRLGVGEERLVYAASVSDVFSLRVGPVHLKTHSSRHS